MTQTLLNPKVDITIKTVSYSEWVDRHYGVSVKSFKKIQKDLGLKRVRYFIFIRHSMDFKDQIFPQEYKSQESILRKFFYIKSVILDALRSDGKTGEFEIGIGSEWE